MGFETLEVDLHIIIRNKTTDAHAPAFGRGVAQLCELVEETGSLNKACKSMGMAYSKAWRIIRNTESSLGIALLERKGAHGSVLTQEAKRLVKAYRQTVEALQETAQKALSDALEDAD